ncbi:2-keto-4-pentenoate hydratase [Falsiroseomonas sp. HW251]|uniref:2-keto-4-pentenoate hydratase n=1 Tax=Falsiroseomonas sp. HW251 TaxID=3390998 RepID=UPI003D31549E
MTSRAATALLGGRKARRIMAGLGADAPADIEAAYRAQHEMAEMLGAVPPAGFKIGATGRQMQAYLGMTTPAAGFIEAVNILQSPATLRYADFVAPGCEPEVALRLARDIAPGRITRADAAAAVGEVFAGIEIVENRFQDFRETGAPTLIADQFFHAAVVCGAPAQGWREADLGAIRGRVSVDGALRGEGVGADLLGHPVEALVWLAGSPIATLFGGLKARQVVFLGSVTPPAWLDGPCRVTAEFDVLGKVDIHFG